MGQAWYLDKTGKWKERPEEMLTFDCALDAMSYINARGLNDGRVCVCHDRGTKKSEQPKRDA